jgi:trimeric autotransporter adhesin
MLNPIKSTNSWKTLLFIIFSFIAAGLYSQNITNTLSTGGSFIIKDAATTFLTFKQSNGYLGLGVIPNEQFEITKNFRLPNSTSTAGIIYKGTLRFIHNFNPSGGTGFNIFVGLNSGNFTMTSPTAGNSSYNTGFGDNTLTNNTTGYNNSALGTYSLYSNTTGYFNTGLGSHALYSNTTGHTNTGLGSGALFSNITGYYNVSVGAYTLYYNTTGNNNTASGSYSLYLNSSGSNNSAFGLNSLISNTTGYSNTAVGMSSMYSNNTGYSNTALGYASLYFNTTGIYNSAFGLSSLISNTAGNSNTSMGINSLYNNTTGSNNVSIGFTSGSNLISGNNNTLIGSNSQPTTTSVSNQITLGDGLITSLRCNVTTITSLSDARDKKDISDLQLGLDFISKLKPRIYHWDKREWYDDNISNGDKMQEAPTAGFIAQELDEVQTSENAEWLNLVLKDNPEKFEATPANLLPVMVKAIQELKAENDDLKNKLAAFGQLQELLIIEIRKIKSDSEVIQTTNQ